MDFQLSSFPLWRMVLTGKARPRRGASPTGSGSTIHQAATVRPLDRVGAARGLVWGMVLAVALHLILLLWHAPDAASRWCTAATVILSSCCLFTRISILPREERPTWFWGAISMLLWGIAHAAEIFVSHSPGASNLTVDASDFIYVASVFPLLLAFSTTREIQSLRVVFLLNCLQIALACPLAYILLYHMAMTPALAAVVMGRIYGAACVLLAVMALLRSISWLTAEERRSVRWITIFLWIYLPIEVGMDYATQHHGLKAGTLLDLLWSVPFVLTGWKAIALPVEESRATLRPDMSSMRRLIECVCPMLINAGILTLAAAVIDQHLVIGVAVIFTLFIIQGIQATVIQMNYLAGRKLLLDRELELQAANSALQELSMLDPLTAIANRRCFDAELEVAWKLSARRGEPLSLIMIDIDFFKGVNDLHGHTYGDECLIKLARVMSHHAQRPDDLVARFGGEEFVFLLPETDQAGAFVVAENLHESLRRLAIANFASPFDHRLTISVGVATALAAHDTEALSLIKAADEALYEAKTRGRNCTCVGDLELVI